MTKIDQNSLTAWPVSSNLLHSKTLYRSKSAGRPCGNPWWEGYKPGVLESSSSPKGIWFSQLGPVSSGWWAMMSFPFHESVTVFLRRQLLELRPWSCLWTYGLLDVFNNAKPSPLRLNFFKSFPVAKICKKNTISSPQRLSPWCRGAKCQFLGVESTSHPAPLPRAYFLSSTDHHRLTKGTEVEKNVDSRLLK